MMSVVIVKVAVRAHRGRGRRRACHVSTYPSYPLASQACQLSQCKWNSIPHHIMISTRIITLLYPIYPYLPPFSLRPSGPRPEDDENDDDMSAHLRVPIPTLWT